MGRILCGYYEVISGARAHALAKDAGNKVPAFGRELCVETPEGLRWMRRYSLSTHERTGKGVRTWCWVLSPAKPKKCPLCGEDTQHPSQRARGGHNCSRPN